MSQLSTYTGVKSVQRGSVNVSCNTSGLIFVSDVVMSKSVLNVSCSSGVGVFAVSSAKSFFNAGARLSAADEITYQAGLETVNGTSSQAVIFWELVEFY